MGEVVVLKKLGSSVSSFTSISIGDIDVTAVVESTVNEVVFPSKVVNSPLPSVVDPGNVTSSVGCLVSVMKSVEEAVAVASGSVLVSFCRICSGDLAVVISIPEDVVSFWIVVVDDNSPDRMVVWTDMISIVGNAVISSLVDVDVVDRISIGGEDDSPLPSVVVSNMGFSVAFVSGPIVSSIKLVLNKLGSSVVTFVSVIVPLPSVVNPNNVVSSVGCSVPLVRSGE